MTIAYLNGDYVPLEEAKISPMDRGFLFGDGIYEVIPYYGRKPVGFSLHMQRMNNGLKAIGINAQHSVEEWRELLDGLLAQNPDDENLSIYVHVSRGADTKRNHAFPEGVKPTVFAYTYPIAPAQPVDREKVHTKSVSTTRDLRWKHCNIKSTSLLGNVLHYQQGHDDGCDEILLFNANDEMTEASSSNAFIVKDGVIYTPIQDYQNLPGITRRIIIDSIRKDGSLEVVERAVTLDEVKNADEVWVTSSSKEIAPVTTVDGKPVADGKVGPIWEKAFRIYTDHKFDY